MRSTWTISQDHVRLSARLPVRAERKSVPARVPAHDHDFYEVCVVWRGHARHVTRQGEQALGPGHMIVVPPGGVHAFWQPRALEVTNLYYLEDWLLADLRTMWGQHGVAPLFFGHDLFARWTSCDTRVVRLRADESAQVAAELQALEGERAAANPSALFMRACLMKCLILMSRALRRSLDDSLTIDLRPPVWAAVHAIEDQLGEGRGRFSPATLARQAGLSSAHFGRIFRADVGLSPREYFQRRRVQVARQRLLDDARSVTEVAHELGFTDNAHLSRHFRRLTGLSPRGYRKLFCDTRGDPG